MLLSTLKTAIFASMIKLSLAQQGRIEEPQPLPHSEEQGQLGTSRHSHFGHQASGSLGQSLEQGMPGSNGHYDYLPFALMTGLFGNTGLSFGAGGGEAPEPPEGRRHSLLKFSMMLLLDQLLRNQGSMPRYDSSTSAQEPNTKPVENTPANNAGQSISTDMSWIPFFLLRN